MSKTGKAESCSFVFTPFTGCAQIYHPCGWYCALSEGACGGQCGRDSRTKENHAPPLERNAPTCLCVTAAGILSVSAESEHIAWVT